MSVPRLFALLLCLLFVACGPAVTPADPTPLPSDGAVSDVVGAVTPEVERPTATPTELPSPTPRPSIPDDEVPEILGALLSREGDEAVEAVRRIEESGDRRFIAVLLELHRGRQIRLAPQLKKSTIADALEGLSGQSFGNDWFEWIEWYGGTDLQPPPGFTSWKGEFFSLIDPEFGEFLQDHYPSRIRVEEIMWGGVPVDGIPALDYPDMLPADEADYLEPWDPIFGMALNGDVRAYPLRILDWHEMANDVIGEAPVSLAYCTLCGAAIAYHGRSQDADGEPITYDFGSSGFLFRSNKLMYDRQTGTLWNQLTGEPVLGPLADKDIQLELLPVVLTTWSDWKEQHPDTVVVDINTGYSRNYEPGAAYGDYFANHSIYEKGLMFPVWLQDERLFNKDHVYALRLDGVPKAYPVQALAAEEVVNDTVGETAVVLVASDEIVEVDGYNPRAGAVTYTAGGEARAYERGHHTFAPGSEEGAIVDESGRPWQVTEEALMGPEGETLPRLSGHLAYWFGWYAFYPETLLYQP